MIDFPPAPDARRSLVGEERARLRYEDVSQDGRMRVEGIWAPTGRLLWSGSELGRRVFCLGRDHEINTVLTRVILEATEAHVRPRVQLENALMARFEQRLGADGNPTAVHLNTWLSSHVTDAGAQAGAQRRTLVARAFGERVLAIFKNPPGQRRLTTLPDSTEPLPTSGAEPREAPSLLEVPPGCELLDAYPRLDPSRVVFGLSHTDSNQHVNSLAYVRFFENAALGRLLDLGLGATFMARRVEIAYRKPCFAGESLRVAVQLVREPSSSDVAALLSLVETTTLDGETFDRFGPPRCAARMVLCPARTSV